MNNKEMDDALRAMHRQYGRETMERAMLLAQFANAFNAIKDPAEPYAEKIHHIMVAELALTSLLARILPKGECAKFLECARRLDSTIDLALLDEDVEPKLPK